MIKPPGNGGGKWYVNVLHSFTGGANGGNSYAGLVMDPSGALYGTTSAGGDNNGVVFQLSPPAAGATQWAFKVIHEFKKPADGAQPYAALVRGTDGALYGTTEAGGVDNDGVVFKLTPQAGANEWTYAVLHQFKGPNGASPYSALVFDSAGALYGTTFAGGDGYGCVFKLTPPSEPGAKWGSDVLYKFKGGRDGASPRDTLVLDLTGAIYGTASAGGSNGAGVIFKLVQ